jgi:hypothetical protein
MFSSSACLLEPVLSSSVHIDRSHIEVAVLSKAAHEITQQNIPYISLFQSYSHITLSNGGQQR